LVNDKPKPVGMPNHLENMRSFNKGDDIKLPIIIHREGCWFFDTKCLYPKQDVEIQVEIHNELLTLGDYKNHKSPFESLYTLDVIYTIPTPDEPWCELCLDAMRLRLIVPNLGRGEPRRSES